METDRCAHYCDNTDGSFNCSCREGFELEDDGMNCAGWFVCKRTLWLQMLFMIVERDLIIIIVIWFNFVLYFLTLPSVQNITSEFFLYRRSIHGIKFLHTLYPSEPYMYKLYTWAFYSPSYTSLLLCCHTLFAYRDFYVHVICQNIFTILFVWW